MKKAILRHFTQTDHELKHDPSTTPQDRNCSLCSGRVEKASYFCKACEFCVHEECDPFPSNITNHPDHPQPQHALTLHRKQQEQADDKYKCNWCSEKIHYPSYVCSAQGCDVALHAVCALLPHKIQLNLFHPQHTLTLRSNPPNDSKFFICDACGFLFAGYNYHCLWCGITLDLECAEICRLERRKNVKRKIQHFCHRHELTQCNLGDGLKLRCTGCTDVILGPAYCCVDCLFYIHISCLENMPEKVDYYPFHDKDHMLLPRRQTIEDIDQCKACLLKIEGIAFSCELRSCDFSLHACCIHHTARPLINSIHEHDLFLFDTRGKISGRVGCWVCKSGIDGPSFYRCVQCDISLHLGCLTLPYHTKHRYHRHDLYFKDSFVEDDSGEYYCDICETERDGKHPVYCCLECLPCVSFVSHIECVVAIEGKVRHCCHRHLLSLAEITSDNKNAPVCNCCSHLIYGPACACSDCDFWLHKSCFDLPEKIQHHLDPRQHPLLVVSKNNYLNSRNRFYICGGCGDIIFNGFWYSCGECKLNLCLICAFKENGVAREVRRRDIVCHRIHGRHPLTIFSYEKLIDVASEEAVGKWWKCEICKNPLEGLVYGCLDCKFFLHDSCTCKICHSSCVAAFTFFRCIGGPHMKLLLFSLSPNLQWSWLPGTSSIRPPSSWSHRLIQIVQRSRSNKHKLQYVLFETDISKPLACNICHCNCSVPFYKWVDKGHEYGVHVECVPFPEKIKPRHHHHYLTHRNREERNHCSYICEDGCENLVAHVECFLVEVETSEWLTFAGWPAGGFDVSGLEESV